MRYAADGMEAMPNARGFCPQCGGELVAKCGAVIEWHWAHKAKDCDPWSEPESLWHRRWKNCFDRQYQEVILPPHRADVKVNGVVIEFQKSNISTNEIRDREEFYGDIAWVLNTADFWWNIEFRPPLPKSPTTAYRYRSLEEGYFTFRWRHPRKSWFAAEKTLIFDMGKDSYWDENETYPTLFVVKKLHASVPCGGWGVFMSRAAFVQRVVEGQGLPATKVVSKDDPLFGFRYTATRRSFQ